MSFRVRLSSYVVSFCLLVVAMAYWVPAFGANAPQRPVGSYMIWADSCNVDSLETKTLTAAWLDAGQNLTLLIEARDDSTRGGTIVDSASVRIKVKQVFPLGNTRFVSLSSHAHPDSGYHSVDWILYDSLAVGAMDSTAVYKRNRVAVTDPVGSFRNAQWGDTLKTLDSAGISSGTASYGKFTYTSITPDFSPALTFTLTGLSRNLKRGVGSKWIFRIFQLSGGK